MSAASPSGAPLNFYAHGPISNLATNPHSLSSFNTVPSSPTLSQDSHPAWRSRQNTLTSRHPAPSAFSPWAHPTKTSSFLAALHIPPILAAFLAHLDWLDVYPLFCSCKAFRDIFLSSTPLRDVVLARFVPGYAHSLRIRDFNHYQDVHVSLHHLDLLLMSQRVPLHQYPTHALRLLTSLYPTFEDDEMTAKLVAYTQAHSRFVLLLQSLVHSSSAPFPLEPEEIKLKSRFSPVHNIRELTFPAPLAYTELPPPAPPVPSSPAPGTTPSSTLSKRHKHSRSLDNTRSPSGGAGGLGSKIDQLGPRRPSATNLSSMIPLPNSTNHLSVSPSTIRRISIFGGYNVTSPPPPQEPQALKVYSNTWRRNQRQAASEVDENGHAYSKYDIGLGLGRPTRRFASADASTSDSSLSGSGPPSIAGRDSPSSSPSLKNASQSPHDLFKATTRIRAPILHVFVPCTKLEDGDESLVQCEKQLDDAGLWSYLSTGDVVCNLGYVPPSPEDGQSEGEDLAPISLALDNPSSLRPRSSFRSPPSSSSSGSGSGSTPSSSSSSTQRKWLLFNGHFLVPYAPPDLLPVDHPLALPSPFYYSHITPPQAGNITFAISRFPMCDDVPQLTLVHATSKVRSPHSPKGYALAHHYAWVARVVRIPPSMQQDVPKEDEMGKGWYGEWMLEYEGTTEGQRVLLDALAGRPLGKRIWELVREKSGGGKIWLRLLPL
ncbi:hypothetical protein CPB84DRAFT_1779731 [Gymnopilus junonius]|uniref:F-box domain-containing protein n=1 Tax=Gymnopilus junonius TaxID=109634 RepID=A0A9P5NK77_GYMJU|nr:hypothetical protein CPB84DRAFT_1779731 [Gymnopilus junonius]